MKTGQASLFCYSPEVLPTALANLSGISEPKGVVYTKDWVVTLLLDLAGYTDDRNLVDAVAIEPAAGEGAFLIAMIRRLVASAQRLGRPISDCRSSIIAYELDQASADRARRAAAAELCSLGLAQEQSQQLAHAWIKCGDYLLDDWSVQADFVLGNPPYVRLEDMPEITASIYRQAFTTMCGRADLYVAFFEAALRQLKPDGVCAFICADRWMRNQYGAELRRLITAGYSVDFMIEMHEANAFEDEVDAYPAITVVRKSPQQAAVVATLGADVDPSRAHELSRALATVAVGGQVPLPPSVRAASVETWFRGSEPWPCRTPEQLALLRRLETEFHPLESDETNTRVGIGVATGNDGVFITTDREKVEPSRLLKLALVDDIRSGSLRWSGHYLVDPWEDDGLVSLESYPILSAYFRKHEHEIKKRNVASKNPQSWFRTIDRVNHSLTALPKLYVADIRNQLSPVLDSGETYPHHNLYFITSEKWDLEVLGGLLMSEIAQFFVESYGVRMRGGYLRFQAQYLRRIRVPELTKITASIGDALKDAFTRRDREKATQVALDLYNITPADMERARGR